MAGGAHSNAGHTQHTPRCGYAALLVIYEKSNRGIAHFSGLASREVAQNPPPGTSDAGGARRAPGVLEPSPRVEEMGPSPGLGAVLAASWKGGLASGFGHPGHFGFGHFGHFRFGRPSAFVCWGCIRNANCFRDFYCSSD